MGHVFHSVTLKCHYNNRYYNQCTSTSVMMPWHSEQYVCCNGDSVTVISVALRFYCSRKFHMSSSSISLVTTRGMQGHKNIFTTCVGFTYLVTFILKGWYLNSSV